MRCCVIYFNRSDLLLSAILCSQSTNYTIDVAIFLNTVIESVEFRYMMLSTVYVSNIRHSLSRMRDSVSDCHRSIYHYIFLYSTHIKTSVWPGFSAVSANLAAITALIVGFCKAR